MRNLFHILLIPSVLLLFLFLNKVEALDVAQGDGILFYAASANTTPQFRTYDVSTNDFSANSGTVAGAQPAIVVIKTSPIKQEAIAAYQDTSGNLRVLCYDGTSWSQDWTVAVAAAGTPTTRRFDVAYESTSGDVTVAYSRNTAAANALAYRTKAGSTGCGSANWAGAANFPTTTTVTSATVMWVKSARNPLSGSDVTAWVWLDNAATNADLGAALWSGSAFTNFKVLETSMEHITAVGDTDNFDVQYESLSGDLMTVWGNSAGANGTNGAKYMVCTGGTSACTWGAATAITSLLDDATNLDLSADPLSDKMAFASIGNAGSDLQAAYWSGTAWTGFANQDTACETPTAGTKLVTTGWVTNNGNTKWYLSYDDSTGTGISYYYAAPGAASLTKPSDYSSTPSINDIRSRYDTDVNPYNNAELIQTLSDSTNGIFAYKLTMDTAGNLSWSNMASASSLGTKPSTPQQGFHYQYWRYIPTPTYTLSGFGFFNNTDSTDVGTTLATANATATLPSTGSAFRLRPLIHVGVNEVGASGQAFKLQYAGMGAGTCASPSGTPSSYTDVTGATLIAYKDNATPADAATLTANANDPTHSSDTIVNQTYEEANNFTNSVATIPSGQDGKWDLSLVDNGAAADATYCLKIVKSDGSALDGYTYIPAVTMASAVTQSISFSIASATSTAFNNTLNFGTLSSSAARYASSTNTGGDSAETVAHTLLVTTNATNGYTITVRGATLTSTTNSSDTITAIGGSNTASSPGSEQFGIRLTASGGTGTVSSPYNGAGYAYAGDATTPSVVGSAASGDGVTTTYSVRYLTNIAPDTVAGTYNTSLIYVVVPNY